MTGRQIDTSNPDRSFTSYRASYSAAPSAPREAFPTEDAEQENTWVQPSDAQSASNLAFWRRRDTPSDLSGHLRAPREPDLSHVCRLSRDPATRQLVHRFGLCVVDTSWEDPGRLPHSAVGPNITDVSLRAKGFSDLCSIVRKPNFKDHTGDFKIGQFQVKVGNETGQKLKNYPLREYLNGIFGLTGCPYRISASCDILVAAQSCVLPVSTNRCEFNVELFNYQTSPRYPACLAIVSCAEGTSAQVVTKRGAQPLFHNRNGMACNFFAERLQDVRQREGRPAEGPVTADEEGRKMLLIFQIPLRIPDSSHRRHDTWDSYTLKSVSNRVIPAHLSYGTAGAIPPGYTSIEAEFERPALMSGASRASPAKLYGKFSPNDVKSGPSAAPRSYGVPFRGADHAQLGITEPKGRFQNAPGSSDLAIDFDAAIRCTVQHYVVTDRPSLIKEEVAEIDSAINDVYRSARTQGSLVVDADASLRATALKYPVGDETTKPKLWFMTPDPASGSRGR